MGPNLFVHNENSAYAMPCVTACSHGACTQASWPPYVYVACQELLMDVPFTQTEQYSSKITASHFSTLNTRIANQNVLKRILIAMHNEHNRKNIRDISLGILL